MNYCLFGFWPCMTLSEWASWIQALGSIAAIAVAVAIPVLLRKHDLRVAARQDRLRAKTFALVLIPLAEQLRTALQRADYCMPSGGIHYVDELTKGIRDAALALYRPLELQELGEVAMPLLDGIAASEYAAGSIEDYENYHRHGGERHDPATGESWPLPEPDDYVAAIAKARNLVDAALTAMRDMFAGS